MAVLGPPAEGGASGDLDRWLQARDLTEVPKKGMNREPLRQILKTVDRPGPTSRG